MRSTHQNPQRSTLITDISENYQTSRGTQFNLTLCDLPIKRLLASKCNKYILKCLQHTFTETIKHTLHALPIKSLRDHYWIHRHLAKYQIYHEHNSIYILRFTNKNTSRLYTQSNIFWKPLQHTFQLLIYQTYALYLLNPSEITTEWQTSSKISDLSRNTTQFDTLRSTNQNTSHL